MVAKVSGHSLDFSRLNFELNPLESKNNITDNKNLTNETSFADMLKQGIEDVNKTIQASDKSSMDLASGKSSNIHETMLAVSKAELGFNMMVQMRNKAIEAYQETMRMQV